MLVHTVRWLCWQSSIMLMKQDMACKNFYWEQEPSITASFAHLKLQPAHLPLVVFLGELPSGACHGYGLLQTVWPFLSAAALHQYSGNWNLWWSIPFSRPLLPALCTFTGGCRPVVILRTCSSFTSLTSAPTWHELQWLRQAVTLPCLDGPALSHPNPACSAPCATLALRWSLTASLGEGMICSDSAWNNTEYMRRVVGFFGRVQQERKIKCRRNKNTTFEISPPKKNQVKKTPCLQSLLVFFRQEREGCSEDTFLKCSQRRLSGEGWGEGGGQRAPVFTSPEPIAAFYYQNNSIPSAGRLPLPGQLYSDAGENLHSAEGWMMPDLAVVNTASSGRMSCPPELAYFLPWVYLCQQISCRSWGIDADCLQQWDWCAGRGRGKRKIRWLHGRS